MNCSLHEDVRRGAQHEHRGDDGEGSEEDQAQSAQWTVMVILQSEQRW